MKILLTGAFGNLGMSALEELLRQGHDVRCFVSRRRAHLRTARRFAGKVDLVRGDMRQPDDLAQAVQGQEVIIHLAYMIPPPSEDHPDVARAINVDGTRYLLDAARSLPNPPRFLFASSLDVFGYTQDQPPPRKVTDPVQATDNYSSHKITCEEMVKTSGLTWSIFRFADIPPSKLRSPHPITYYPDSSLSQNMSQLLYMTFDAVPSPMRPGNFGVGTFHQAVHASPLPQK